ncbi:hypothetical protein EBQ90_03230 [bacterium]|nr:hypothetical protein [bacterium]
MSPELEEKLCKDFPSLFSGRDKPITESLMSFGCECLDGWYGIIRSFCWIAKDSDIVFTQIKEKYGGLRLYYFGGDDRIAGACRMAEEMSYKTCEVCGCPGAPSKGGWIMTRCESCRAT